MIKNILLAEDDRVTAILIQTQLKSKGYTVFIAGNGIEALESLSKQLPDIIITDVVMPKMDGVDLYNALKSNPKTAHIPIIIVTDKAIFKDSFSTLGVSYFVEKSSDISKLLENIQKINNQLIEAKRHTKVLINSNHQIIFNQMQDALVEANLLVTMANNTEEILSKALAMLPHIIVLDVLFQDKASITEIIRALRCFSLLKKTKIITYTYIPDDLDINAAMLHSTVVAEECIEAGADQYIGRFNRQSFISHINNLKI